MSLSCPEEMNETKEKQDKLFSEKNLEEEILKSNSSESKEFSKKRKRENEADNTSYLETKHSQIRKHSPKSSKSEKYIEKDINNTSSDLCTNNSEKVKESSSKKNTQ